MMLLSSDKMTNSPCTFALRYPALPSAARIRMLQRKLKSIKLLSSPPVAAAIVSDDISRSVSKSSNGEKEGEEDDEFLEEEVIE